MTEAIVTGICLFGYAAGLVFYVLASRAREAAHKFLEEARICNAEFAEAIALSQYGAHEEAIEVCQRWIKRLEKAAK